jgi:neural Wiskott-Aldrich syndrome protein
MEQDETHMLRPVEAGNPDRPVVYAQAAVSLRRTPSSETSDSGRIRAPVRWLRSVLTSAFLALAAVVPAASIAAEPDRSQEGGLAPEQGQDLETDSPSFDPGGDTDLPFDSGPPPASQPQASPDDGPVESEPTDDPDGRLAPLAAPEAQVPGGVEDAPVRPVEGVQPGAPPAPGFSIEPPPSTAAPEAAPAPLPEPQPLPAEPGSGPKAAVAQRRLTAVAPVDPRPVSPPAAGPGVATPAASDSPEVITAGDQVADNEAADDSGAARRGSPADRGGRVHVVRPGESLWTIAEGLLGPDASATSIAAEVARLWELNRELIPSGDPDLITVGQQLILR